jgi:hypothetical protein
MPYLDMFQAWLIWRNTMQISDGSTRRRFRVGRPMLLQNEIASQTAEQKKHEALPESP